MLTPQFVLALATKLVVDLFAGGGGASTGIEQAIGRHVDIAINHDADAIGMHTVNHPQTRHYREDIRRVDPRLVTQGAPVGLLHASPDCTHHSQALGGQPRSQEIRSLAWMVIRWAGQTRPDVITLENVEQMLQWSPLVAKRDPATGRVITLDKVKNAEGKAAYRVADPGEVVPRGNQFLVPSKKDTGRNWKHFVQALRDLGYKVEWRVIRNADLGAHSTRTRLYMVARCDDLPIVWPEKTHARKPVGNLKPWRPAADCIDWSIPGTSIFGRKKPLAEATMRRIAHGMKKFVLDSDNPYIVAGAARTMIQMGYGERDGQAPRALDLGMPLGVVTAGGQKFATAAACLVQMGHGQGSGATARRSYGANDIKGPVGAITASGGGQGLATAFMVQANGGFNATPAHSLQGPVSTVTTSGSQQQLAAAHLVQYQLSQDDEAGALQCAAFLMRYHASGGQWADLRDPMTTITTHDRLALVTVWLKGEPWVIVDITLRMLVPRELYNAQDFPKGYVIDRTDTGKVLTKTAQVRMAGNSVSPLPMQLIVAANYQEHALQARKAA
ncbi:DNA cytosine methyltransferase [Comamonas aquatica]|uniref:DNA (cytosine-5-)-methyltransferase n=1 Tax=Comamonas aquatica TaxID=225991 RepID=A0AA43AWW6_9BURK|nr:DNA cytosine methyltransferase [Comamonas aquatica]MDH1429135.1 DNA cytosine methyltransferase [Comamonas aquatica]MDH1605012.1 DNA cytosine methyltransferase [Comamonas aquatica]MDH1616036.1 DNA cytosine methyltransferase [Comamonas aquatica]MDH2004901.1 DNA cytosine methyltransferase [Comamonas aquatica]